MNLSKIESIVGLLIDDYEHMAKTEPRNEAEANLNSAMGLLLKRYLMEFGTAMAWEGLNRRTKLDELIQKWRQANGQAGS